MVYLHAGVTSLAPKGTPPLRPTATTTSSAWQLPRHDSAAPTPTLLLWWLLHQPLCGAYSVLTSSWRRLLLRVVLVVPRTFAQYHFVYYEHWVLSLQPVYHHVLNSLGIEFCDGADKVRRRAQYTCLSSQWLGVRVVVRELRLVQMHQAHSRS